MAGSGEERPLKISGERARQGRIVLTTPRRRVIFIAGLAALVVFPLVVTLLG